LEETWEKKIVLEPFCENLLNPTAVIPQRLRFGMKRGNSSVSTEKGPLLPSEEPRVHFTRWSNIQQRAYNMSNWQRL
jgi:hypothetical protein